jgi:FkbM family methyltransferase
MNQTPTPVGIDEIVRSFLGFYAANKHNRALDGLTDHLLSEALSARGFNNFRNGDESGERFFIEQILAPTDPQLCLDIGANVGNYTRCLLDKTQTDVIAFEPLSQAFNQLEAGTAAYGSRATPERLGIGARNGILPLRYNPDASEHASFAEEVKAVSYLRNDHTESVPVVTLDHYIESRGIDRVDFIKIDVEGYEADVLEGAAATIARLRPRFVQIEFNWHQLFRNTSLYGLSRHLEGYQVHQLVPGGWVRREVKDPLCNLYHYSNFVFSRD